MGAKTGIGIAAAALLALGIGGSLEIRSSRAMAEQAVATAAEAAQQARAMETKLEGSRSEIDALRRVVESRNSELTSLRDKVNEMDKKGAAGGFAGFGGLPVPVGDQVFVQKLDDNTVTVRGADGKDIRLPDIKMLADANWAADGKPHEVEFPGGKMVIMMQGDANGNVQPFNVPVPPPNGADAAPRTLNNNGANAMPDKPNPFNPNAMTQVRRAIRANVMPAVPPPAPPAPNAQPKGANVLPPPPPIVAPNANGKAEGEF